MSSFGLITDGRWSIGDRVQGSGFRIQSSGFRVQIAGFIVHG